MLSGSRFSKKGALALCAVAGLACSFASAQTGETISIKSGSTQTGSVRPLRDGGLVYPVKVEVDGVEVPFSVDEGGVSDLQAVLYDNRGATANSGAATHQFKVLDDFAFAGGQAARITGFVPSFVTPAAGVSVPLENVVIEVQFFGGYNPAVTPVNGGASGNKIRVTYAFPAGVGWAAGTVYTGAAFIIHSAASVGPVVSSGCFESRILRPTTFVPHPDIMPAICGAGPVAGTSADNMFFDLNNDNIYQGADAGAGNEATGPGAGIGLPGFANLRFAIQGQYLETGVGACCLAGGSCVILPQSKCLGLSGTYNGDGSTCASVAGHCATPPVLHNNGPMITGPVALNGTPAPAGTNWAEGAQEGVCASGLNGPNISGTFRVADDFTVPAGKQWAVNKFSFWSYASPGSTTTSPVTGITLRIWNGPPNNPGSTVVFGDTTTNLYPTATAAFDNIYRIFNSGLLAQVPGTTRAVWKFSVPLNLTLPAGTYWADWNVTGGPFAPQVTLMTNSTNGVIDFPAANALQFVAAAPAPNTGSGWQPIGGNGAMATCLAELAEMPFIVEGTESNVGGGCYADCDGVGGLTANDFACFLLAYTNGASYADCDGVGGLTANDFACFLLRYTNGCS